MEPLASISGLASGIDFADIVDQIIEIESDRLDYLRVSISEGQAERAAWGEVRTLLEALNDATAGLADGSGLDVFNTSVVGLNPGVVSATANAFASPGSHTVRVLQKAQREVLGSDTYASGTSALGLSGQFIIQGSLIDVSATDSLTDIASRVNALNVGPNAIGVSASVVGGSGAQRLVLSASDTGAAGISLLDLNGVLASLGVLDGTTGIKNRTSGGFESEGFSDATTAVGTLLGFASGAPTGTVTLGAGANAFTVALDLGALSLEGVRDAINAAAASAGAATFAQIETSVSGGATSHRLSITGEAAGLDDGAVLQALGLFESGRGSVAQVLRGDALTTDAGGTPATASTALSALFNGASNAGVTAGDTLLFQGTDHDGVAFSFTHTIQAGDTLQTLLTRLEGVEGFNGSATATVDAGGRLTLTATTAGASRLSLSAFAGNEAGGILDLGAFTVTAAGRHREISQGADAIVEIDGALVTSASNAISNVVSGVTFDVLDADPLNSVDVVISRNVESVVESLTAFVDAYNAFAAFVRAGSGVIGESRPPLTGDLVLRGIRDRVQLALLSAVPSSVAGAFSRLSDIGLEVQRDGSYRLDAALLTTAFTQDPAAVRRIFTAFGVASSSALTFVGSGSATQPGTYDVTVTQLGSSASLASVGFGGTYVDDGTADTLTIGELASGASYDIALSNGMTLAQIIDAINTELAITSAHEVTSERTMFADAGASTLATAGTALADLHHGAGQPSGFVAGTELTFSGTRPDGSTVLETFNVTDPTTQTLGSVRAALQSAFGAGVSVSIAGGELVVRDASQGQSLLSVSVGSDIPGNAAPFGQMLVSVQGRDASGVVAEAAGSELRLRHSSAGTAEGFSVALTAGGSDGTGSLGLAAGSYAGTDVAGTIGGEAATGAGHLLVADAGTTAAGLTVRVSGTSTGSLGTVTFGTGIMSDVHDILGTLLGTQDGSIDGIVKRIGESVDRLEDRLFDREDRLEERRVALTHRFVALEQAIARAQSIQEWLASQLGSLQGLGR